MAAERAIGSRLPPPLPKGTVSRSKRRIVVSPKKPRAVVLSPEELEAYKDLLLFAKAQVEGYFSGRHRSPYRGTSAEFAEFKEYSPGDCVDDIDWRVYGRSRRLYLRQHEEDTDMILYLLLDTSASMEYAGNHRDTKLHIAAKTAAALAYLTQRQGDKTALAMFSDRVDKMIPPGGTLRHLHQIVRHLEVVRGSSTTGIAEALAHCDTVFKKRGQLVLLSDFHADHDAMFEELNRFQHRGFGVLLLQILDPDELALPLQRVARFVDMETGEVLQVDPSEIRASYRQSMRETQDFLAREADAHQFEFATLSTSEPYTQAFDAYMGVRNRIHHQGRR